MKLKKMIKEFKPFNEQEKKDQEILLKYINTFDDVLTRANEFAHFTSSAIVLNKDRTKALMIYHNIYDSWGWPGGHADGEEDLLTVATREVQEETGVKTLKALSEEIFLLDTLPVIGHFKRGKYVPAHIHLSIAYLIEADEFEELRIKEDENSGVKWISLEEIVETSTEPYMKVVYQKAIEKLKAGFVK